MQTYPSPVTLEIMKQKDTLHKLQKRIDYFVVLWGITFFLPTSTCNSSAVNSANNSNNPKVPKK